MSPLWVLPLLVTATGTALLALAASRAGAVSAELRDACRSLAAVRDDVRPLADRLAATRGALERISSCRTGIQGGTRAARH